MPDQLYTSGIVAILRDGHFCYHRPMVIFIAILSILILIYLWSSCLLFYREKRKPLVSDESKCFDQACRSIVIRQGSDKAVLMVHGFPTTPAMYRYASECMKEEGYDVFAPLIPSFGADWHDFVETDFSSWYGWIEDYYLRLCSEYSSACVSGISMGGAMTLRLAETHRVKAAAVIGAPVVYNSLFRDHIVTSWPAYLLRIIGVFTPAIKPGIVRERPGANDGNEDWKGYSGTFPRQGASLVWNLRAIRRDLPLIDSPILSIHDRGDRTVPFANQGILKREMDTEAVFIETEMDSSCRHSHHALLMYRSVQSELMDRIISFFAAHP